MRRLTELREAYRRADLSLRTLLFGDSEHVGGRLKGEESRQQANAELRRMRRAFDETVEEAEAAERAEQSSLPDDLIERAAKATPEASRRARRLRGPLPRVRSSRPTGRLLINEPE